MNELDNLADPNEIAKFGYQNPRDAFEIYQEARTPAEREAVRKGFIQYVWGDLDPNIPDAKAVSKVQDKLRPYMKDTKVATAMMGPQAGTHAQALTAWAKFAPNLKQRLQKDPKYAQQFLEAFNNYFLVHQQSPADAATSAMQKLMSQMPGAQGQRTAGELIGGTPFVPEIASRGGRRIGGFGLQHVARGGLNLAMGNVGWAGYQALEALTFLGGPEGFMSASKMGAPTRFFVNAFKASTPAKAGWWLARGMDAAAHGGAVKLRQGINQPVEME